MTIFNQLVVVEFAIKIKYLMTTILERLKNVNLRILVGEMQCHVRLVGKSIRFIKVIGMDQNFDLFSVISTLSVRTRSEAVGC